jgi:tetratricopeptide (TPR) repeat protein
MSRFSERARIARFLSVVLVSSVVLGGICGCEQLEARKRTRDGNRMFRETQFVDAAAEYEKALTTVDDPIIHYNLGLAYSKIAKAGYDAPVLLGTQGEFACTQIPGVKMVEAGACVKAGDRHYAECGSAKSSPIEKKIAELGAQLSSADDAKKQDLQSQIKDKQDEILRYTCASSFKCYEGAFCSLRSPELADLAARHFQIWIKAQPADDVIKRLRSEALADLELAKKAGNNSEIANIQRQVDDLGTKDQTRKLMTKLWVDSEQHRKAIDYWESLLQDRPNDPEIMGNLAGINLSAGDWRRAIEWYNKVADVTADPSSKVASYQFIGNIAWGKLNSRTLVGAEAVELADRGIGALQKAAEVQPKNFRLFSIQASIFNFRSTVHGASWAAAADRASAQDLSALTRVLADEAKKAQQGPAPGTSPPVPAPSVPPASATPPATPPAAGSAAAKSGG